MDYKTEYGRYKKKVEDQQKVIQTMTEQAEGWQDTIRANNAVIAAILEATGSVTIKQDTIKQMVENATPIHVKHDVYKREITLGLEKPDVDL